MPVAYIETLDDNLVFDQQANFSGGQVSHHRATEIGPQQAWILEDVDLETNGALRTRLGWHANGNLDTLTGAVAMQGVWWFDSPTFECLLVVAGGKLYRRTLGGWALVDAAAVPSSTLPVYFAQINNVVFIGDGTARPRFWNSASLATPAAGTLVTDGPAKLTLLAAQNFRLFGLNADTPDEVWVSGFLPTTATPFSPILPIRVGEGEGDPITALVSWKGWNLIAFKGASTWAVSTAATEAGTATDTAWFSITRVSGKIGCIAPRSAASAGNDLLFLASDGVRSLAKTAADGDGELSLALSEPIQDVVDRINLAYVHLSCGICHKGRYLLAVPLGSATSPDTVLVLNMRTMGWMVWKGLEAVQFVTSRFNTQQERVLMLDARRQLLTFKDYINPQSRRTEDYKDTLDGVLHTRPVWKARTRSMAFGELLNPKQPRNVELTFDRSSALADVRLIRDDDEFAAALIATKVNTGYTPLRLTFTLPAVLGGSRRKQILFDLMAHGPCRSLAVEVTETKGLTESELAESGPLGLSTVIATAWLNAMET